MTSKRYIPNVGTIVELPGARSGRGVSQYRQLLTGTLASLGRHFRAYFDATQDSLLRYSESSLESVVFSAMATTHATVFAQEPVRRRRVGGGESPGHVDLWAHFRKLTYLIELKQGAVSARSKRVTQSEVNLWAESVRQLRSVTRKSASDSTMGVDMYKVALIILRVYQTSKDRWELEPLPSNNLIEIADGLSKDLHPRPSWIGVWAGHKRLQAPLQYGNRYVSYPGMVLAAWIDGPFGRRS